MVVDNVVLKVALHVSVLALNSYALNYSLRYIGEGDEPYVYLFTYKGYAGKFKFLTFINFLLQTVYFGLSLLNDLWGSHVRPSDNCEKCRLQRFLDIFLASVCYPVGTFVVMTFWGIYAVDRELVFPRSLDAIIPPWQNHAMHTTVLPFLLIEKYMIYHEYPGRRRGISILMTFATGYLIWILWVAYYANIWVYPILQVMEAHQRVIFITVLLAFFISIYIVGDALNTALWRKEVAVNNNATRSRRKKKS